MKLFECKRISGLADVSKEVIFCFGRYNPEKWFTFRLLKGKINPLSASLTILLKGGFYFIINSPFKFKSDFISAIDFIKKNGIIKHRILFSLRKKKNGWQWTYINVKRPLDDKCEIDCIDPAGQHPSLS